MATNKEKSQWYGQRLPFCGHVCEIAFDDSKHSGKDRGWDKERWGTFGIKNKT